jgi:hypothetical protein
MLITPTSKAKRIKNSINYSITSEVYFIFIGRYLQVFFVATKTKGPQKTSVSPKN